MLEDVQLRFERNDARGELVRHDVHREAVNVQVLQKRVAKAEGAAGVQISALKSGIERVEIRLVLRGVQLRNQPLLNAVEPLILA